MSILDSIGGLFTNMPIVGVIKGKDPLTAVGDSVKSVGNIFKNDTLGGQMVQNNFNIGESTKGLFSSIF